MADEPEAENSLAASNRKRTASGTGEVPDAVRRRYYTSEREGPGVGYYVDAQVRTAALRDRGRELVAARADPNAIRDMTAIAQHRGWSIVTARGSADFRREAWIAGRSIGLEVRGYRPTERDLQDLQRRQARRDVREDRAEVQRERRDDRRHATADGRELGRERREDAASAAQLRVVEAVVRSRVADPQRQEAILAATRDRVADWLERGARFTALRVGEPQVTPRPSVQRSRTRG